MSPLATICSAWAAVFLYLCAYYGVLHARRRTDREYLLFGLLCGAMGVYALGSALRLSASSLAQAASAERIAIFGVLPAATFFVDFVYQLLRRQGRAVLGFAYAVGAVGMAANLAGLCVDPTRATDRHVVQLLPGPARYGVWITPIGGVVLALALGLVMYGTALLAGRARRDRSVFPILVGAILLTLAGLHDLLDRLTLLESTPLAEHGFFVFAMAVSYALLGRFVETADALTSRTLELRRSYNELRDAQEELLRKEQLATMGELSAVIAHEVRNPLAIIKNAVSGLHRANLRDQDRQVLLKILDEEADRLNRLVGDLLAYARPVTPQEQEVDVPEIVRAAVDLARNASPRGEQVQYDLQLGEPRRVAGDADLLKQALVNVADNAIQAMPDGGTLTVRIYDSTLEGKPATAMAFRDTGEGMDTLVRSKAGDPFFTTRATGTGLGLAIVHRLVHSHGGKVQIESSYGTGTTVTLVLPERSPATRHPGTRRSLASG